MKSKRAKENNEVADIKQNAFVFQLFITGASPNSMRAVSNVKTICEEYLKENYDLEIIDVYREPMITQKENIIALPMLIRRLPLPEKRFVGNMSDIKKFLNAIGVINERK